MKTTLLSTNNSASGFRLISILFVLVLRVSNLSSQSATKIENSPKLFPVVHYAQKTKSVNKSSEVKVYTVMIAKTFPTIESGEKSTLNIMDDSENFDYEGLFCSRISIPVKKSIETSSPETTSLALNYQIHRETTGTSQLNKLDQSTQKGILQIVA